MKHILRKIIAINSNHWKSKGFNAGLLTVKTAQLQVDAMILHIMSESNITNQEEASIALG
ncbi:MAG: hypothetical protein ACOC80_15135 [Petrotogales bacterium]